MTIHIAPLDKCHAPSPQLAREQAVTLVLRGRRSREKLHRRFLSKFRNASLLEQRLIEALSGLCLLVGTVAPEIDDIAGA
jgi:hypothetical protein